MAGNGRKWTSAEVATLRYDRKRGLHFDEIAPKLGRTAHACQEKLATLEGRSHRANYGHFRRVAGLGNIVKVETPQSALDERDRAYAAPLTFEQAHLGDPIFGRSALDRRNGVRA